MTEKITELTAEQQARFPEFVERWTNIGLCTEPADRKRAEAGIRLAYETVGLTAKKIVWCSSPLAMALTRAVVVATGQVLDSVKASIGASNIKDKEAAFATAKKAVNAAIQKQTGNELWASVWTSVRDSLAGELDV